MTHEMHLRDVEEGDLPVFFEQQLDSAANHMAAFTAKEPGDRAAFTARWSRILGDASITKRTIVFEGRVVGHILGFEHFGKPSVSYWIGREYWGRGIATKALAAFLGHLKARPLYARAARDNVASLRVLEKCGFRICGYERGFAHARAEEVDELVLELKG